jgi:hypothetical protein
MADYLKLLRELATIEPPLFVFGGVAEAVLLDRRLDLSHGDLDLLTPRTGVEHRIERLGDFGFAPFDVYYEPRPGLPLVYGATRDDLTLELSVLDYDSAGMPYFALPADAAIVAVAMPADLFEWPPTIIRGVRIHTLSPLALIQIRSGGMTTGAFGPTRPQDTTRQARLIETFFPDRNPTSLQPRITTIGNLA